jgi:hypothetical protein
MNKQVNTNPRVNSATSEPDKDIEKKKKLEYQNVLKQQIEDNNRRKEEEKRKKKEEDIMYSKRYANDEFTENNK